MSIANKPAEPVEAAAPTGQLRAARDAPVGGQAVLEGVMMRGIRTWSVAVRKPSDEQRATHEEGLAPDEAAEGEIAVVTRPLDSWLRRHRALRLPVVRGVVALAESLKVGFDALGISANAQLPEEEREISGGMWAGTIVVSVLLAVGLFFLIPVGIASLIKDQLHSSFLFWLIEGLIRTGIFLGYLLALSRLRDLRRVFEYHGAEHKTISCFEAGLPLTPANAERFSRLHPRCGTTFLLLVMVVAIFVFAPIGLPAWYWLLLTRVLGVPLIAGISFELIKLSGRQRHRRWVRAIMWPGIQLQYLTTREPDHSQLAVAIAALNAVLEAEPDLLTTDAKSLIGVEVVA
ncbi:MAG TPA: DUF1385 domain-containing protein [Conexibacter sp.]|nr:DUF1385 domain-containing protein [Conexibacter sp.]